MKDENSPYQSRIGASELDNEYSEKPIMLRRKVIDKFWFDRNHDRSKGETPARLDNWMKDAIAKAEKAGWSDFRIEPYTEAGDENNLETDYLVLRGSRMETQAECDERVNNLRLRWLRDFEEYLRRRRFYDSPMGKAQVTEALKSRDAKNLINSVRQLLPVESIVSDTMADPSEYLPKPPKERRPPKGYLGPYRGAKKGRS